MSFDFANIDPHNLGIRCRLNGETVQDSNTNQLVHKTQELVAWISQCVVFSVSVRNNILSTYKNLGHHNAYVSCLISILQVEPYLGCISLVPRPLHHQGAVLGITMLYFILQVCDLSAWRCGAHWYSTWSRLLS